MIAKVTLQRFSMEIKLRRQRVHEQRPDTQLCWRSSVVTKTAAFAGSRKFLEFIGRGERI